ncbi:class I SAM-dependent methyltransferase [Tabrizicola sp.]|uniref:class I SAM-dependent methyltransferase n=1 Tax=Tabrizicola sp. TaxID=2005166 RepID=UPI00386B1C74
MGAVEARFRRNADIALGSTGGAVGLHIYKGESGDVLTVLAHAHRSSFDMVYVDGSHQAPDVLLDALLGFRLLRVGGLLVFDDYLWSEPLAYGVDPVRTPKLAIDAFTTIFCRKIRVLSAPLYQLMVRKTAE